jgi:hypothetical protein
MPARRHWPDQSGYFDSSWAAAPAIVRHRAVASTIEPIEPRWRMTVLRERDGSMTPGSGDDPIIGAID